MGGAQREQFRGKPNLCGIAGFTHLNFRAEPERIRNAAESILHRGPDQQGFFESDTVSLAATRLKIIDLETGDQPIVSADGDCVIVFNGEISTPSCGANWSIAATASVRRPIPK